MLMTIYSVIYNKIKRDKRIRVLIVVVNGELD